MAEIDKITLKAKIDTLIQANGTGAITATVLNGLLKDMVDSLKPLKDYSVYKIINTNYTISSFDYGKIIKATGTITVTCPDGLPEGFWCIVLNEGTGEITFVAATTSPALDGKKILTQFKSGLLQNLGLNIWHGEAADF